jgi:hypothetical protein
VGGNMNKLKNLKLPISVEVVKNKYKKDFFMNKTYIEKTNSERVIYMDSDTVVLNKLDKIYKNKKDSFIAKKVHNYDKKSFNKKDWYKILRKNKAKKGPYFNAGFFITQNRSHGKICSTWKDVYAKEKKDFGKNMKKVASRGRVEQVSLSISVLKKDVEISEMRENQHVYGWRKRPEEVDKDAIVYHTGSRGGRHLKYASAVAGERDFSFNVPIISSGTHPLFLKLQGYDLGYRTKHFFTGVGD